VGISALPHDGRVAAIYRRPYWQAFDQSIGIRDNRRGPLMALDDEPVDVGRLGRVQRGQRESRSTPRAPR